MRILLTNDDGIDAEGLAALERIARHFSDDIWIVAPDKERSGSGCSLSFSSPMRMFQKDERKFAVDGTPVDCVMIALHHLMEDNPPDLVLSGVNHGQNIAEDLIYSGTVSGAIQGCMAGIASISLSQAFGFARTSNKNSAHVMRDGVTRDGVTRDGVFKINWQTAEQHAPAIISQLLEQGWEKDVLVNVNFPDRLPEDVEGVSVTRQGRRDHPLLRMDARHDPRGRPYFWVGFNRFLSMPEVGSDLHAIYSGRISVTPIHLNLTHQPTHESLDARLNASFEVIAQAKKEKA